MLGQEVNCQKEEKAKWLLPKTPRVMRLDMINKWKGNEAQGMLINRKRAHRLMAE